MNRIVMLLPAMFLLYCGTPSTVEPKLRTDEETTDIKVSADSVYIDGLGKEVSELDSTDIAIIKESNDETIIGQVDSLILEDEKNTEITPEDTTIPLIPGVGDNNAIGSVVEDFLIGDNIDSAKVADYLDSMNIDQIDSSNVKDVIDNLIMSSEEQVFDTTTTNVMAISQTMKLDGATLSAIMGDDVDVPEDFEYDLPVLISFGGDEPVIYIPVGENVEFADGQLVNVAGKVQQDTGEDQKGFKLLYIE